MQKASAHHPYPASGRLPLGRVTLKTNAWLLRNGTVAESSSNCTLPKLAYPRQCQHIIPPFQDHNKRDVPLLVMKSLSDSVIR